MSSGRSSTLNYSAGHTELGDGLEWETLEPVDPYSAERFEYVLETSEDADELAPGLAWQSEVVEGRRTIEEVLDALGEAKRLLYQSRRMGRCRFSDTDGAVFVWCAACSAAFYVTAEPRARPYCGGEEVSPGYAVSIHPT